MSTATIPEAELVEKVVAGARVSDAEAMALYQLPLNGAISPKPRPTAGAANAW